MQTLRIAAVLFALVQATAQQDRTVTVQLLAINDLHGHIEPPDGPNGLVNQTPAGGVEYLATHLRKAAAENPNSIVVAAGDLIGASPLISGLFHDGPAIEAANAFHLAITAVGNHELDHGVAGLDRAIQGGCPENEGCRENEKSPAAHFEYLAANTVKTDGSGTLLPGTSVRTIGGVKIGFIGETLEGTDRMLAPPSYKGLRFLEETGVANAAAERLEREGVHAIVLLIHEGGLQHASGGTADPNGCANLDGGIVRIANQLSPAIKVVISGHTHQFYNCEIAGHTVTSASSYGRMFTRVNLTIDRATDTIVKVGAKNEIVTRDVAKDPAETAIIEKYRPRAERLSKKIVGSITAAIGQKENSAGESALGDVIADAQLASAKSPERGGGVVSFMNSGGIRASLAADGRRDVSFGELYTVQPFGNRITVFTMTGEMIRRLLEQQFRSESRGNFLQVSEGFTYRYRMQAAAGQHVVDGSIMLNGKPIAPADQIRVVASDFLAAGSGGFSIFREGRDPVGGMSDIDALVEYFTTHSPVAPGPQNRIVRID